MHSSSSCGQRGVIGKGAVVALSIAAAVAGWVFYSASKWQQQAQQALVDRTVSNVFSNMADTPSLDVVYQDADGDLVADIPEQEALQAKPTELVLSFIASEDPANSAEVWEAVMTAIGEKTGLPVTYLHLEESNTQLAALRSGRLHITAFSSGAVPAAVNHAGFVPLCTIGNSKSADSTAGDDFGYTMQFIVKADSPIKDLGNLRDKRIVFVRPRSNSGCKAAMILLWEKYGMQPERDYQWSYSYSHSESIAAVLAGKEDAAPVASDLLSRIVAKGDVPTDGFRVIYESERFPPVAIGCAHDLPQQLRETIQLALLEFDWKDTRLAEEMAAAETKKFLPVVYKDDWANIRRVDQAASKVHSTLR